MALDTFERLLKQSDLLTPNQQLLLATRLIEKVHDGCLVANDKNIASCLRVICLKYLNVYSSCAPAARAELTRVA